jgi:hypothetical protein
VDREIIGERGQCLFVLIMTELCGRSEPVFFPRFLGDKYPTFDYIVHLIDRPEYYFFVQVKATTQGYTAGPPERLKVQVSQIDIDRMVACPAPSYIVGMDMNEGVGFLLSVNETRDHVASLTTSFKIDCNVLRTLADEVSKFWSSRDMILTGSQFSE